MNANLKILIANNDIGFTDVLEAYAQLCIDNIRDITQDMILDEGVACLIDQGMDLSVEGLTGQATDWALVCAPEMVGDNMDDTVAKKEDVSWLEYVIRASVIKRVKETGAFQVKFS